MKKTYRLSPYYLLQQVGKDTVLLPCGDNEDVDFSKMIILNKSGAVLVNSMEQRACTQEELVTAMQQKFEAPAAQIMPDVIEFLDQMVANHYIEVEEQEE